MSKKDEALKLALEALKQIDEAMPFPVAKLAQKVIREALAEQPAQQQEPVCNKDPQGCWSVRCQLGKVCKNKYPPASKPWVGLTDEEQQAAYDAWQQKDDGWGSFYDLIEAKLREKNA